MRTLTLSSCLCLATLFVLWSPPARLDAQVFPLELTLQENSNYATGCLGPSPCLCPVMDLGEVTGALAVNPVLPPLGPIFDYDVVVDALLLPVGGGPAQEVVGSGLYRIDVNAGTQSLDLELDIDGLPHVFTSYGFVDGGTDFPSSLFIEVYEQINGCVYNGLTLEATAPVEDFVRGDCNADGAFDVSDAIATLQAVLVPGTPPPPCDRACDSNDDGSLDVADGIYVLSNLFSGGAEPPPPFAECGLDPTLDNLECEEFLVCP